MARLHHTSRPHSLCSALLLRLHKCLSLLDDLSMINVLELDDPFGVELLGRGSAQLIQRTAHCTFDL